MRTHSCPRLEAVVKSRDVEGANQELPYTGVDSGTSSRDPENDRDTSFVILYSDRDDHR